MQVEAIEQRARHARLIVGGAARRPGAGQRRIAEMTAPARVHRGDHLHPRREGDMHVGPDNGHSTGFQRLAQRIQHGALEFRQFVEEQDTKVSQADLSGTDLETAANQGGHGSAMVRSSKRPPPPQSPAFELSGNAGDHRDFEGLGGFERRQDAGQAGREKRLSGAGRPAHQQIMSSGRGDL